MNVYDLFQKTARQQPVHQAILGPGIDEQLSYGALDEAVCAMSSKLRDAGVRGGGCVALHCPSGKDYIVLTYAIWKCEACVVPVATELTAEEQQLIIENIAIDHLIFHGAIASTLEPYCKGSAGALMPNFSIVPIGSPRDRPSGYQGLNSAFIRFTSGTTGASKGVILSHETINDRIYAANEVLGIGPSDSVVWLLSMSYHFTVSIVSYLTFGAGIILPRQHFAPEILRAAEAHKGTLMYGSPLQYSWMADCKGSYSLASLRLAISTTTAMSSNIGQAFKQRFGLPVTQALGLIEIGLPCINIDFAEDRPEAVGRVLPAYQLKLEDTDLGPNLKELLFKGKGVLDAYYEPWQPRSKVMADGWFRTGDVGEVDSDGCLFIRGRAKDVINVGGNKFFPYEVESVLASHPDVESASIFPYPDTRLGEVPHARVVVHSHAIQPPSERDLLAFCKKKLAAFKVPAEIEFVTAQPTTASGKIVRRAHT
ncbi:MAG: acyl--CoA ligase [Beijerinckiaceae bacterium]|nr:acyl--CoA ligase [Beijerinckiaceae bacterium]MCI0736059.1 acyl--CoA ligase [Beijerinckiaceae bacterium]